MSLNIQVQSDHATLARIGAALLVLICLDAAWLSLTRNTLYASVQATRLGYGLVAWLTLATCIAAGRAGATGQAAKWGAAVGASTYLVFNGTELAIRPTWPLKTAAADAAWGTAACTLVAVILYHYSP